MVHATMLDPGLGDPQDSPGITILDPKYLRVSFRISSLVLLTWCLLLSNNLTWSKVQLNFTTDLQSQVTQVFPQSQELLPALASRGPEVKMTLQQVPTKLR